MEFLPIAKINPALSALLSHMAKHTDPFSCQVIHLVISLLNTPVGISPANPRGSGDRRVPTCSVSCLSQGSSSFKFYSASTVHVPA